MAALAVHSCAHDSNQANARELTITLEDMDDLQLDRIADHGDWIDTIPEIETDDAKAQTNANELTRGCHDEY